MLCPNPICRSCDIGSNHIPEHVLEKMGHAAQAGHHAHWPIVTFGSMAAWGLMKAINSVRSAYRCNSCGATFDA